MGNAVAVVGVVNVTPDSFSDGGLYAHVADACRHVDRLWADGADVIEVGGESTRPSGKVYGQGYTPVEASTQLERVAPVVRYAVKQGYRVAIDTQDPNVALACLNDGASIVNDVSMLADAALAEVIAAKGADLVLMHSRPNAESSYTSLVDDVAAEWRSARDRAVQRGLPPNRIVFDPGFGFGKGPTDNARLLARLASFRTLDHAIYVGLSRKSFIAAAEVAAGLPASPPDRRDGGSIAAGLFAIAQGAQVVRVHDVHAMVQALAVTRFVADSTQPGSDESGET